MKSEIITSVFWNGYQMDALRTLHEKGVDMNILHCALGMAGELGEIEEHSGAANLIEELGDFLWYAAVLAKQLDANFADVMIAASYRHSNHGGSSLVPPVSVIVDKVKRLFFYNKPLEVQAVLEALTLAVARVWDMAEEHGLSMRAIGGLNIAKLAKRFPDKFTEQAALVRDIAAEQAVFIEPHH